MRKKIIACIIATAMLFSIMLTGCANTPHAEMPSNPVEPSPSLVPNQTEPAETPAATDGEASATETPGIEPTVTPSAEPTDEPTSDPADSPAPEPSSEPAPEPSAQPTEQPVESEPVEETDEFGLTEQQRNSYSMLYFLAITAEEIRISKDNSLVLDDIYTSLFNDINPGAIDETTQTHLENLRNVIEDYIDISTKRERLQFLYNQEKAASIRSAVPDPLAILSLTNSLDWKKMAASVVYTVVDSYNNYKDASEAADLEFLMNGWELDDEATEAMRKNRRRAFNYMVDIVQEYGLDGKLTLSETAIETFAEICEISSVQEKIRRLESEEGTYQLLGNYWLELADCYFETEQYRKCLDCVETYNKLSTSIYRKDYNYVQILPKAIVAAQKTSWGSTYVTKVEAFAKAIIENTEKSDESWSVRYFAAQAYLDLYSRTDDRSYLKEAYNIAYDNMTLLLDGQRNLNATYLAEVKELTVEEPDYRYLTDAQKEEREKEYKEEQKRLKAYNKELKTARETELPPLYEPLILNCDLLFALAEEIGIKSSEKAKIEAILQTDSNGIFLSDAVNNRYSFDVGNDKFSIQLDQKQLVIPVNLLSAGAEIVVTVTDGGKTTTFDDYTVKKVEREGATVDTFFAYFTSEEMKDYKWSSTAKIKVEIFNGESYEATIFNFKVVEYKDNWMIGDKVVFQQT